MGFSISGSTAVILIGVLIAAGSLHGAIDTSMDSINEANDARLDRAVDAKNTEIDITTVECSGSTLTIEVTNTGTAQLPLSRNTILLNGDVDSTYGTIGSKDVSISGRSGSGDPETWLPGEELEVSYSAGSTAVANQDVVQVFVKHGVGASAKADASCS